MYAPNAARTLGNSANGRLSDELHGPVVRWRGWPAGRWARGSTWRGTPARGRRCGVAVRARPAARTGLPSWNVRLAQGDLPAVEVGVRLPLLGQARLRRRRRRRGRRACRTSPWTGRRRRTGWPGAGRGSRSAPPPAKAARSRPPAGACRRRRPRPGGAVSRTAAGEGEGAEPAVGGGEEAAAVQAGEAFVHAWVLGRCGDGRCSPAAGMAEAGHGGVETAGPRQCSRSPRRRRRARRPSCQGGSVRGPGAVEQGEDVEPGEASRWRSSWGNSSRQADRCRRAALPSSAVHPRVRRSSWAAWSTTARWSTGTRCPARSPCEGGRRRAGRWPRKNAPLRISATSRPPGDRVRRQQSRKPSRWSLVWQYSSALSRQMTTSKPPAQVEAAQIGAGRTRRRGGARARARASSRSCRHR